MHMTLAGCDLVARWDVTRAKAGESTVLATVSAGTQAAPPWLALVRRSPKTVRLRARGCSVVAQDEVGGLQQAREDVARGDSGDSGLAQPTVAAMPDAGRLSHVDVSPAVVASMTEAVQTFGRKKTAVAGE